MIHMGDIMSKVHSLRSDKVEMCLCAVCHAFTLHVDGRRNWFRFRLEGSAFQRSTVKAKRKQQYLVISVTMAILIGCFTRKFFL